jgi:hypothetical protein
LASPPLKRPELTLDAIEAGLPLVEGKTRPDVEDILEYEEREAAHLRNELARSHIKDVEADREMRKTYAGRILRYLEFYSAGVAVLILLSGFRVSGFTLEPHILAALVGSTAVAAIGLVGFIARGLFRAPPDRSGR